MAVTGCALAATWFLNYLVDPDGTCGTHLLPPYVLNLRPAKLELLDAAKPSPQALIFGSSRMMTLDPAAVEKATGLVTFNAAVDGARTEDFYCLLRYAVEHAHVHPNLILIGVDIEALHSSDPPNSYLEQPVLLGTFLWRRPAAYARWMKLAKRLTSGYETEASLISISKALLGKLRGASVANVDLDSDGLLHHDEEARVLAMGHLSQQTRIQDTIDNWAPRYDEFTEVSPERLQYLRATIVYAHKLGSQVIVLTPPMHPFVEEALGPHGYYSRKTEALRLMREICTETGSSFYDFSSPRDLGGDLRHFFDGVHHDGSFFEPMIVKMFPPAGARAFQ